VDLDVLDMWNVNMILNGLVGYDKYWSVPIG